MKVALLRTMDFNYENVQILNCKNEEELIKKFEERAILKIQLIDYDGNTIEYGINSDYVICYRIGEPNTFKYLFKEHYEEE